MYSTKPKKNKRVPRKDKMATLRYYAVDEAGKVTRLRKECPSECCPGGVFMATHFDRYTCGRCQLAYKKTTE